MPFIREYPPLDRPVNGSDTLLVETDAGTRQLAAISFKGDPGNPGPTGPEGPAGPTGPSGLTADVNTDFVTLYHLST